MWAAARRSDRILTVSEASKRDILHFFNVPPEKIVVVYNAIDERFCATPSDEDVARVRERYQLDHRFVLYVGNIKPHKNLVRLIEAFSQLRRTHDDLKLLIIGDEISKLPALRRAVHQPQAAQARALPRLPPGRHARGPLSAGLGVRLPVALRRIRPAAARSDGERHAGRDVERLVAAGGHRRRRGAGRSLRRRVDRGRHAPRARRPGARRGAARARDSRARASSRGSARSPRRRRSIGRWQRRASSRNGAPGRVSGPRVALVHDWLTGMRGGEKVLEALCELYPDADLFTLVHRRGSVSADHRAPSASARRSCSGCPLATTHYRALPAALPVRHRAVRASTATTWSSARATAPPRRWSCPGGRGTSVLLPLADAVRLGSVRRVLRSGAGRAHGEPLALPAAAGAAGALGRRHGRAGAPLRRQLAHVAGRIRRYYNREATVVYPPVDTVFYHPADVAPESHFLIVSALVPYKRIDLAIAACERLGVPLRIVGDGPDRARLEHSAGPQVTFLGWLLDDEIRDEYRRAAAVILPGEEDFGIVPVEAQACGRPAWRWRAAARSKR